MLSAIIIAVFVYEMPMDKALWSFGVHGAFYGFVAHCVDHYCCHFSLQAHGEILRNLIFCENLSSLSRQIKESK